METTEKIVEAYVRHVMGLATITNIRCPGQQEIDLIAINPKNPKERYHIEVGVSISGSYSKLTCKSFAVADLRTRVKAAGQRRTLGYFIQCKFEPLSVVKRLEDYGFVPGKYHKVIVTWGWQNGVEEIANQHGVELWDFRKLIHEIVQKVKDGKAYSTDDIIRTLHLFTHANPPANIVAEKGLPKP